jgi:WD40 repeat protein
MGVVYKARHLRLDRLVALKMIRAGGLAGEDELARFGEEARAVARLQHPNIVQIYEVGEEAGQPYLALEYVEGGSLARRLSGAPLPGRQAAELIAVLAQAVHHAHRQGVVHRDLKPANVLLARDGTPKITDFGLAKTLDQQSGQTRTGAILGTPSYMAPEQAAGKVKEVGPAADVWALGAILYELLTGRPPFRGESVWDTLEQVRSGEPVAVRRLQPKVPRDLETICLKCLHKEPRRRYRSAGELAEDCAAFLDGKPVQARPVGKVERFGLWCRRNPILALASGAALLGLMLVTALSVLYGVRQAENADALGKKEQEARVAATTAETARKGEAEQRGRAERLSAGFARMQGLTLCNQGEIGHGLLWLVRSLALARRAKAADIERDIRANLAGWRYQAHTLRAPLLPGGHIAYHGVALSPDGKTAASAGDTGRLWDVKTGKAIGGLLGHTGEVSALAYSPDGATLVTAGQDGTIRFWQAATARSVGPVLTHPGWVRAIACSPDGTRVVSAAGNTARIWDVATGRALGPDLKHARDVDHLVFSPDGKLVLTASREGTARLWDSESGRPVHAPFKHTRLSAIAFSPDGRRFLTAGRRDGVDGVHLWDTATGGPVGRPLQHPEVDVAAFSPNGKVLLTGGMDFRARLWDVASGQPLGPALPHHSGVSAVAFAAEGRVAVTASWDRTVRLWSVETGKPFGQALRHPGGVNSLDVSRDSKLLLTGSIYEGAYLWEIAAAPPLPLWPPDYDPVMIAFGRHFGRFDQWPPLSLTPDGKALLARSEKKHGRLWDLATELPRTPPLQHDDHLGGLAVSADGRVLLTGSYDRTARLWDAATGKPLSLPLPHVEGVDAVAVSPDGKLAVTGTIGVTYAGKPIAVLPRAGQAGRLNLSWDVSHSIAHAYLWDAVAGRRLATLQCRGPVRAAAFSRDGRLGVVASEDGTAWLLDMAGAKPIRRRLTHDEPIRAVAFRPDGRLVVTAGSKTARLWNTATGKPARAPLPHGSDRLAFSPDGKILATAGLDGAAWLWDVATGQPACAPLAHSGPVLSVAFSPDGQTVLTAGGSDRSIGFWDAGTGKPLGPLVEASRGGLFLAEFLPGGRTVLTVGGEDKRIRRWPVPFPVKGEPEHLRLWVEVLTGTELREDDMVRLLAPDDWAARRRRLQALGEPSPGSPPDIPIRPLKLLPTPKQKPPPPTPVTRTALRSLAGHTGAVTCVACSPDGRLALSGGIDRTARLWDLEKGTEVRRLEGHDHVVWCVAFSPDGKKALTGSEDRTVQLWDVATGKHLHRLEGHTGIVSSVVFSADGRLAVSGSWDQTVRTWDVATGQPVRVTSVGAPVLSMGLSPSEEGMVALGSTDGRLRFLDLKRARVVLTTPGPKGSVESVVIPPGDRRILSAGTDGVVRLHDLETKLELARLRGHRGRADTAVLLAGGRRVLSCGEDGTIRLWDLATGAELHRFEGHGQRVRMVAVRTEGRQFVSAGFDGTLRVWRLPE